MCTLAPSAEMRQIPRHSFGTPLGRGVFVQPFVGSGGGVLLVAVSSQNRRVAETEILPGGDHVGESDKLWAILEAQDPDPRANLRAV